MKVLVVGAAGKLGRRIVYHLLSSGHEVTAFVRSASRLLAVLPASCASNPLLTITEGDALSVPSLSAALRSSEATVVINCAGVPGFFPWQHTTFPAIGKAVADACLEALPKGGRVWMLAGMFVCDRPGGGLLMDSTYVYTESRVLLDYLRTKGASLDWAILCPGLMQTGEPKPVEEGYDLPPRWPVPAWLCHIPVVGFFAVSLGAMFGGYTLSFDSVAVWLVGHLEDEKCRGKRVALRAR
ncbi:NAD(P)-binding protein [Calocera viscosa TUFC12733]|uniref:NAD(P)-binding protein n=1 Tax=Calocera viscosa (strain TUFC12733) TaxID=1330018 RepID=A0A167R0M9_CALVF|nr:NAD(P)-binding protein [Calocera viscosa TUFC12733]